MDNFWYLILLVVFWIIRYFYKKNKNRQYDSEVDERSATSSDQKKQPISDVYLKDGTVRKGTIVETIPSISVKIKTLDGYFYVHKMDEIEKITKEEIENTINENQKNTKKCPYCKEEINIDALKCRYCGEILSAKLKHVKEEREEKKSDIYYRYPILYLISFPFIISFILGFTNPSIRDFKEYFEKTYFDNKIITSLSILGGTTPQEAYNAFFEVYQPQRNDYWVFSIYHLTFPNGGKNRTIGWIGIGNHFFGISDNADSLAHSENQSTGINNNAQEIGATITIGNQVWTSSNLNVSNFRNGDPIPEAESEKEWVKADTEGKPVWCYYNGKQENGIKYGKLYNWYAVHDRRGLTPQGWHIPTYTEWSTIINYLGDYDAAAKKMKSKSSWKDKGNGNNSSGFSAFPSGERDYEGGFYGFGEEVSFWSSSFIDDEEDVYILELASFDITHQNGVAQYFKGCGYSCRCIKN